MIALLYINTYIIWFYNAIISYFALAKYTNMEQLLHICKIFPYFIGNYNNFMNIHITDVLYFLWCKYGCFIFIKYYHIFL